ncbi:glycosyltransferase [Paenibacillus provencensis]|uniref:Glycosyltransferase n=1 Tax=Paenibacillus provencensis TaxID=441151 RepID=A0ABW3PU51_9BACL|nr:glycosyltransferase [Paenibacillus sp. MER 78]
MRHLAANDKYQFIIISSGGALNYMQYSLKQYKNITYREAKLDLGYILNSKTLEIDRTEMNKSYISYMQEFSYRISVEERFLSENKVNAVISDISPVAIAAADGLGIKSLGISNFTWYSAYQSFIEDREMLLDSYNKLDHFLMLPGSNDEPLWGRTDRCQVGFYCRDIDPIEMNRLLNNLNPNRNKIIVYFVLGMSIQSDLASQLCLLSNKDYVFIVSSNMNLPGENIYRIPQNYTETQNLLAISNVVISKPGWSTVSEAVVLNKPLIVIKRDSFSEDKSTIKQIINLNNVHQLSFNELMKLDSLERYLSNSEVLSEDINLKNHQEKQRVSEYIKSQIEMVG